MTTVTVSPKYQVVIPKDMRQKHCITPGMKMAMVSWQGSIHLVPVRSIKDIRGLLPDIDTKVVREADRSL